MGGWGGKWAEWSEGVMELHCPEFRKNAPSPLPHIPLRKSAFQPQHSHTLVGAT